MGGQPKHPGVKRELLPPEKVDEVVELEEFVCPTCGGELDPQRHEEMFVQQTIELPESPVQVTEYRQYGHWCEHCQRVHYAPLPAGVIEGQLCGPRLQSLVAYLKGKLGASYSELKDFFQDVLDIEVSRGLLCRVVRRVNDALAKPYEEVQKSLPQERGLNVDETGWKDSGRRYWVWLFCTQWIAFFTVRASRGSEVLKQVLGDTFEGAITSDFYSAYVKFANAKQQFCLAHLIRDIKFLITLPDPATQQFGKQLLDYFRVVFRHWHARDDADPELLRKRIKRVERKLFKFLLTAQPPPGAVTTMKKRLVRCWPALFRFAEDPDLYEPTNNRAEQTMRQVVRIRRQTQGTRSEWGQQWCSRIMTVLGTCRKQHRSSWQFIYDAVLAQNFKAPMPSLIRQAR